MLSTCCYACRIADYMLRGKSPKSKLGGLSPPVYKVGRAIAPLAPPVPTPMAISNTQSTTMCQSNDCENVYMIVLAFLETFYGACGMNFSSTTL